MNLHYSKTTKVIVIITITFIRVTISIAIIIPTTVITTIITIVTITVMIVVHFLTWIARHTIIHRYSIMVMAYAKFNYFGESTNLYLCAFTHVFAHFHFCHFLFNMYAVH